VTRTLLTGGRVFDGTGSPPRQGVLAAAEAGVPVPDAARRKAVEVSEAHADSFRRAVAAGVKDGRLVAGHV
jgi:hypothetical protein